MAFPLHISLRPLALTDEPFLWEMLYQAIYVPPGQKPFPRELVQLPEISRYVAGWGRADDAGLIALDEMTAQPVAAAWWRMFAAAQPGYGFVDEITPELTLAVFPAYRGQGIGSALLQALSQAAALRYSALSLSVSVGNPAARLYARSGFVICADKGDSLTMVQRLHQEE